MWLWHKKFLAQPQTHAYGGAKSGFLRPRLIVSCKWAMSAAMAIMSAHLIGKKISRPSDRRYQAEWSVNMDCFGFYLGAEALTGIDALCTRSPLVAVH